MTVSDKRGLSERGVLRQLPSFPKQNVRTLLRSAKLCAPGAALGRTAMYVNNVSEGEWTFCPYPPEV
jgi:hypothetical protein